MANDFRLRKGKLASYILSQFGHSESGRHLLDNDASDYDELRQHLIQKRLSLALSTTRSHIQMINYNNSRLVQMPTEVLLQVFRYLDKAELFSLLTVCREFLDLIVEILWFRPNMQSDTAFHKISEVMKAPRGSTHWDYRLYIKRLNLSFMTKLVDDELLELFVGCPKLERLTLVNCTKLSHGPITAVLEGCCHLQLIDMTGVQDIHDDIIYTLAHHCPRLQGLYAPGCGNISEDAVVALLRACPMLKRVKFNNSDHISDATVLPMYENCRLLVEIDLHNCPNVSDTYLKWVFRDLPHLREFRISNAPGISDHLFDHVPHDHVLDKLRIVDLTGCNAISDRLVDRMVRCAPRLRNVVLSKCMQITDSSLRHLAKLGRSLHYVHLGHCALITDFGVQALVRACHRIQYIDLACCSQLTDWLLIELASLPKLRRIGLVKCNLVSDAGIMELVRRRGDNDCLERVHLSYCTNLTIGPIYFLLKSCPRLTHLSLTGISAFLRREITQYCRDPPPDFTESQKSSFCVFSGHGVVKLRNYLDTLMEQRAYFLESYGFHDDVANALMNERRRLFDRGDAPPNDVPMGDANADANVNVNVNAPPPPPPATNANAPPQPPVDPAVGALFSADDDLAAWAAQRGLGELRRMRDTFANPAPANTPPALNDPQGGHGGRFSDSDAILRQLLSAEGHNRHRFTALYNPVLVQNRQNDPQPTPGNAPHITQAPVFGDDQQNDDTDMEVDLFPRRN